MLYGYRQLQCPRKTECICKDIAEEVGTRLDTSNYELGRPLPKGKYEKVIGLMKDELGGKIMKTFVGLRVTTYSYLIDDDASEDEKAKGTKKCHKKDLSLKILKTV